MRNYTGKTQIHKIQSIVSKCLFVPARRTLIMLLLLFVLGAAALECRYMCDDPLCHPVCEAVCSPPNCETVCDSGSCSEPDCEITCPGDQLFDESCPMCETVCAPTCSNCTVLCEATNCNWYCVPPTECDEPVCELICESPACEFTGTLPDPTSGSQAYAMIALASLL